MTGGRIRTLRLGGLSIQWRKRTVLACLALGALVLVLAVLLLGTGTIRLSPAQVVAGLMGQPDDPLAARVLHRIRLPRVLTAMLVGAALGMSGAVFQSLSRNALGSPDVIGFTTGAATGAIVQIILFNAGPIEIAASAVLSGLVTAFIVLLLARGTGSGGGYRLILVGIGVGAVLGGVNTLLMVMGSLERAMSAQIWLAGSLNSRNWTHVSTASAGVALFVPLIVLSARKLTILEMGPDLARQLGVNLGVTRMVLVLAAVGLTSVATASAGPIGFVALAGPQIARRLTRSPAPPIISGALMGAVLLLAADLVSQNAPFGALLPIGAMTGLGGGLYLVLLLSRSGRSGKGAARR